MLQILLNPGIIGLFALTLAIVWMLRDERDKTRPFLVMALVVNLFYGWLLTFVMGRENSLVPWKYDYVLMALDSALGVRAASVAAHLQGAWRLPLVVVYQLMLPMMVAWFLVARRGRLERAIVGAYIAEMLTGPLFYALVPACGPLYAWHAQWLTPPVIAAHVVRLSGMPNAFPSLHVATALLLVLFAYGKWWRAGAAGFLGATILATLSTGEHYVIDLVAGLAFGCFAAAVGRRRWPHAVAWLAVVLAWSLSVRFAFAWLDAHAAVLRIAVVSTVVLTGAQVIEFWRIRQPGAEPSDGPPRPSDLDAAREPGSSPADRRA